MRTREAVNLPSNSSIDLVSEAGHREKRKEYSKSTTKSEFGACRIDLCSDDVTSKKHEVTINQATKAESGACRFDLCSNKVNEDFMTVIAPSQAPYTLDVDPGKRIVVDLNADESEPSAQRLEEFMKSRGSTVLALNFFGEFDSEVAQLMRIQSYVCVLKGIDDRGNLRHDVVSDAVDIRLSTQEFEQQVRSKSESGHERDLAARHLLKMGHGQRRSQSRSVAA